MDWNLTFQFSKIVVAIGTEKAKILRIPGYRTQGVLYAVDFMRKINAGETVKLHGKVVVIGGGSVAMDVARTAIRSGAEKVTAICLESGDAIPAHKWELEEAKEEGINLISGVSPVRFLGHESRLEGVEYIKIENLDTKNFHFDKVEGSESSLEADFCIVAVGQNSDKKWEGEDLLFCGDAAGGKCSVIDAMASGRRVAMSIDNELSGREYSEYDVDRTVSAGDLKYKIYPAIRRKLQFPEIEELPVEERNNFDLVEKTMSEHDALTESYRCLSCGYRSVDITKCIGCGACQKICPKGDVIQMIAVPEKEEK